MPLTLKNIVCFFVHVVTINFWVTPRAKTGIYVTYLRKSSKQKQLQPLPPFLRIYNPFVFFQLLITVWTELMFATYIFEFLSFPKQLIIKHLHKQYVWVWIFNVTLIWWKLAWQQFIYKFPYSTSYRMYGMYICVFMFRFNRYTYIL